MTCIITFDVGGKIYRVSQSLLNQYPNSMLTKLASNYHPERSDAIFVERDSKRFQHVLDYMRDGKIYYPKDNTVREAIHNDLKYLGFPISVVGAPSRNMYYPNDLKYVPNVECHQITWDVTRAATGLIFQDDHTTVMKTYSDESMSSVLGIVGYSTGIHYWNIQILETDPTDDIRIGITTDLNVTVYNFAGYDGDSGMNYFARDGSRYYADNPEFWGPSYSVGDVIGTLLNMDHRTLTFYKNGERVGIAAGRDILIEDIYYPCVSLMHQGHKVTSPLSTDISIEVEDDE